MTFKHRALKKKRNHDQQKSRGTSATTWSPSKNTYIRICVFSTYTFILRNTLLFVAVDFSVFSRNVCLSPISLAANNSVPKHTPTHTHIHTPFSPSPLLLFNTSSAPLPPLSAPSLRLDVERDGVNTTVCVFPFNSGMHNDKKIVTTFGTVILFGCVLYSW